MTKPHPLPKTAAMMPAATIAAGVTHSLAIREDGSLWAWGKNKGGQFDDGINMEYIDWNAPRQMGAGSEWVAVAAGDSHAVAIKANGSLWAWGQNDYGQLGDGTNIGHNAPARVGKAKGWAAVAAGSRHTLAIKSNGSLWAWGSNEHGQLGDGTNISRTAPVQVGSDKDWKSVSTDCRHNMAIKADGSLWAWGANDCGQLGDGTDTDRNAPVRVGEAKDWAVVAVGASHTLAIKNDGSLWAWGSNHDSEIGTGDSGPNRYAAPVRVDSAKGWKAVSAGDGYSAAISADGSLWAWGFSVFALLCSALLGGALENRKTPGRVGADKSWAAVASGGFDNTLALKADGSLWAWRYDGAGGRITPIRVGTGFRTPPNRPPASPSNPKRRGNGPSGRNKREKAK